MVQRHVGERRDELTQLDADTENEQVHVDEVGYVTWKGGTWHTGLWKNGTWKNGTWKAGTWVNGTWCNGIWKNGIWYDGTWHDGTWHDGTWKNGIWEDGTWKNGVRMSGIEKARSTYKEERGDKMSKTTNLFWIHERADRRQQKPCLCTTAREAMHRYMESYPDNLFDDLLHKVESYKYDPKAEPTDCYTICVDDMLYSRQPSYKIFKIVASLVYEGEDELL